MTRDQVAKLLSGIAAVYKNFQVNSGDLDMWAAILLESNANDINGAAMRFFKTPSDFAPNPGQLIEMARQNRLRARASTEYKIPEKATEQVSFGELVRKLPEDTRAKLMKITGGKYEQ